MRIAVFNTSAGRDGAAAAMRRLVKGLRARGHEVDVFCLEKRIEDVGTVEVRRLPVPPESAELVRGLQRLLQDEGITRNRTALSNTLFSQSLFGYRLADPAGLCEYDAVNIHWVAFFLSIGAVEEIASVGKPVLVTLHDMQHFTGGCHYAAGCRGFAADCSRCPQLEHDGLGLPALTLSARRRLATHDNVAAVAPSRWMRDCAAASRVFAPERSFAIANAVETEIFRPLGKASAKAALGLRADSVTLLVGAHDNRERRKGFRELMAMLARLKALAPAERLLGENRLDVLAFGSAHPELEAAGFPVRHLGYIGEDHGMAAAYGAADLFVLPTLEDNQPNVMLEAMACGTPVVSFAVGGVPEVITDGVDGVLVRPFETGEMAHAVAALLASPQRRDRMAAAARECIERGYTLDRQASQYESLLERMRAAAGGPAPAPTRGFSLDPAVIDDGQPSGLAARLQQLQRKAGATVELEYRDLLDEIERLCDRALSATVHSTSWRLTGGLRRIRGSAAAPAQPTGAPGERILAKLDLLMSIRQSASWELMAPLRLARRALDLARRRRLRP